VEVLIQSLARIQLGTNGDTAGAAGHFRSSDSDSPFGPRANYAILNSILAALLFASSSTAQATTFNAASPSLADVRAVIASAANGDTVAIPAGTATWTSTLNVTKAITLAGAGIGQTIIRDNIPRGRSSSIINWTLQASRPSRMTGIEFQNVASSESFVGAIMVVGSESDSQTMRIDHCAFTNLLVPAIQIEGALGVADHNTFTFSHSGIGIEVKHNGWGGRSYGDGSWADRPYFGTSKFFFFEDNTFNNNSGVQTGGNIDSFGGGRYVARHNIFNNALANTHGTESGGRQRSVRAIEIYNNAFNFTFPATAGQIRGGTALIHDNVYTGQINSGMSLHCYRQYFPFNIWGGASGINPWDLNDPHGSYATGTHTAAQSNRVLIDSHAHWATNQWTGYSLTNTVTGRASFITGNTGTTITYAFDNTYDPNGNLVFQPGDGYAIYRIEAALDQPGRGRGDLITGDTPRNSTTRTAAWPHQVFEPIYSWNNTINGSNVNIQSVFPTIQEKRDYYNQTAMPGYISFTYPHPLTTGAQPTASTSYPHDYYKKENKKWGKLKRRKWGGSKENSANVTIERFAPDQQSK
jgi:hypothetical protein